MAAIFAAEFYLEATHLKKRVIYGNSCFFFKGFHSGEKLRSLFVPYTMIDLFLIVQLLAGSGCGIRRVFDLIRKEEHDVPGTCTVLFKDAFPL